MEQEAPDSDQTEDKIVASDEKVHASSDFENDDDEIILPIRTKTSKKVLDSDSDNEMDSTKNNNVIRQETITQSNEASDEELEKHADNKPVPPDNSFRMKYSSLLDSDTESEGNRSDEDAKNGENQSDNEEDEYEDKQEKSEDHNKRNSQPIRMSAKQAIDQMRSIKSETQRLNRESYVSIPYHKPKQYTLKEFMNRRSYKQCPKSLSVKMSQEELEEFARQLEERAKEATDFFKSDTDEVKLEKDRKPSTQTKHENSKVDDIKTDLSGTTEELPVITESEELFSTPTDAELLLALESQPASGEESQPISASMEINTPKSITETVFEVLKERNVVDSPTLTGSPTMIIDLDTGDFVSPNPTGVDKLFQRFLKHSIKKKPKESSSLSIVSTDTGVLEITNVDVKHEEEEQRELKPGAAYQKLQNNLKKIIEKKRKDELLKRLQQNDKENNKEGYEDSNEITESEDLFANEELYEDDEEEEETIDETDEAVEADKKEADEMDSDNELEADDEYDSDDEKVDDTDDEDLREKPRTTKKRIIVACDDDSDNEDAGEFISNFNYNNEDEVLWTQGATIHSGDEDELLGLCSGRFDPTQKSINQISQIPTTQCKEKPDDDELLALCSGTFPDPTQSSQFVESTQNEATSKFIPVRKLLESSDEENISDSEKKKKERNRKTKKLEFSDDEDELIPAENDNVSEHNDKEAEESEIEEEIPETYVDYDSEENEIAVQNAKDFLEKEAELSESEWGSADEDEKGLDHYEIDFADEEEFDKDKLQSELGKIHMRRLLDDDIRNVKKIQEMFLEDEETDGVGRQRQFRWKNLQGGFDLDAENPADGDLVNDEHDENDEMQWRRMRHEREILLQEKSTVLNTPETKTESEFSSSTGKKINIINVSKTQATVVETKSPFLIARTMQMNRGSFLVRGEETLSKLAVITKASSEQESVQIRSLKAKNFVFAAIEDSSKSDNSAKRKSIPDQNNETNVRKKFKPNAKRKVRLIDQLV